MHLQFGRALIRRAVAEDQTILVDFRLAMLAEMAHVLGHQTGRATLPGADPAVMREANNRWVGEHFGRDFVAWLADLDGRPVATAGLMWFAHPPGPADPGSLEAYILNVYTRPEARRMGLARALIQTLVEEARSAGVRRIWLRTSPEGRRLYEGMGFGPGDYLQLTLE
jgi:GNAT superfamily N-acetyltransferase